MSRTRLSFTFARALVTSLCLGCVIFAISLKRIESLPVDTTPPQFDAQRAFNWMSDLSKKFPNRVTWAEPRRQAAQWLKGEFRKLGYTPQGMKFSEIIAGNTYNDLENIYAEKRGTKFPEEIIVVAAHYDITDTTVEGAMDDASGVAVVLELARVFSRVPSERTLLFLLNDSEEFGAFWGAHSFVRQFDRIDQVIGVANFDFVGPDKQTRIITLTDGLKEGYTPLWLREIALGSIRSLGEVRATEMTHIVEFAQRALQIPAADHGAFLAAGIPAFNWAGQTDNFAHEMQYYHHTPSDRVEIMRPESLGAYGRAAERVVRTLNGLGRVPENPRNSSYWKITSKLYLEGWVVTILHLLAFVPFLVFGFEKFNKVLRAASRKTLLEVVRNEAKLMGILLGSFLIGFAIMRLLPELKIITQYEIFPATQKSRILHTPNFVAILLVLGSVAGMYALFRKLFREKILGPPQHIQVRHAFHAALLACIIALAFVKNSYLAVLLLLPPAYTWTALSSRRKPLDRVLNFFLLLAGSISFVALMIIMTTIFHVGIVYWYLFLAAIYGLLSAYSVVLFFMALTVLLRLLRSFVL